MSKAALADLSKRLTGDSKEYRNKTVNPEMHSVNIRATSIKTELRYEIEKSDPELLKYITDQDIGTAASKFRATLMQIASSSARTGLRALESDPNVLVANTYGTFSAALQQASQSALKYIASVLNKNKSDYVPLLSSKTIQLDHTRTVSETRITSDIIESGIDPLALIKGLQAAKYISKKEYKEVYTNILDINSYYKGDNKEFVLKGKVVQGELRSGRRNEAEGNKDINPRTAAFKKAIRAAIADVRWAEQAASDSYVSQVTKRLTNAAVKAGATGNKAQKIDRSPSKTSSSSTSTTTRSMKNYKAITLSPPKAKKGVVNLVTINAYISSRLPEAIRANMGPGSLVNRSGRFSESARITGITTTPQGYPSIGYTYQRSPYDIFDPTLGKSPWNTPGRDPKKLIDKSIRDIAKELSIGRFYTRRT